MKGDGAQLYVEPVGNPDKLRGRLNGLEEVAEHPALHTVILCFDFTPGSGGDRLFVAGEHDARALAQHAGPWSSSAWLLPN